MHDFFQELDGLWKPTGHGKTRLPIIGATALLRVHESTVIDCAFAPAPAETTGAVFLCAGRHPFRLYWQCSAKTPRLDISGPSIYRQTLPSTRFFHD